MMAADKITAHIVNKIKGMLKLSIAIIPKQVIRMRNIEPRVFPINPKNTTKNIFFK